MPACDICKNGCDGKPAAFCIDNSPRFEGFSVLGYRERREDLSFHAAGLCDTCRTVLGIMLELLSKGKGPDIAKLMDPIASLSKQEAEAMATADDMIH